MVLYTKPTGDCPLCHITKLKLDIHKIEYEECKDDKIMDELNIDRLPVLQLDNGSLLDFSQIMKYLEERGENN